MFTHVSCSAAHAGGEGVDIIFQESVLILNTSSFATLRLCSPVTGHQHFFFFFFFFLPGPAVALWHRCGKVFISAGRAFRLSPQLDNVSRVLLTAF